MIGWALQRAHLFLLRHSVQPLALPSAIHLRTATMPALTVTLSANAEGSALGASGLVGWVFGLGGVGLDLVIYANHIGLSMMTGRNYMQIRLAWLGLYLSQRHPRIRLSVPFHYSYNYFQSDYSRLNNHSLVLDRRFGLTPPHLMLAACI